MTKTKKLVISGLLLALTLLLPFLTGQIPQIGQMLSPMHIPVLLCGFICGWPYGLVVGLIAPLLRSILFQMPPMYPVAVSMAFELAAYGLFSGLFYKYLPKKTINIYVSLILSMLIGRIVWGIAMYFITLSKSEFSFQLFLTGAFVKTLPGIILHILLIPAILIPLKKSKSLNDES